MNKILVPKITFKDIISDEKRIETMYARFFEIARRNILAKRHLTNDMSLKYTDIQDGRKVFDDRGSSPKVAS